MTFVQRTFCRRPRHYKNGTGLKSASSPVFCWRTANLRIAAITTEKRPKSKAAKWFGGARSAPVIDPWEVRAAVWSCAFVFLFLPVVATEAERLHSGNARFCVWQSCPKAMMMIGMSIVGRWASNNRAPAKRNTYTIYVPWDVPHKNVKSPRCQGTNISDHFELTKIT